MSSSIAALWVTSRLVLFGRDCSSIVIPSSKNSQGVLCPKAGATGRDGVYPDDALVRKRARQGIRKILWQVQRNRWRAGEGGLYHLVAQPVESPRVESAQIIGQKECAARHDCGPCSDLDLVSIQCSEQWGIPVTKNRKTIRPASAQSPGNIGHKKPTHIKSRRCDIGADAPHQPRRIPRWAGLTRRRPVRGRRLLGSI